MSIISSLFIFLLCFSMHACNARHFGVVDTDSNSQLHFPSKVEEKVKPNMDSSQRETNGDSIPDRSYGGAITQNPKESKALLQDMKYNKGAISGSEIVEYSSSHVVLLKATKIEESRRRARAVLEFVNHVKEEAIDSNGVNGVRKDAVVTDYEPPHRTPPIHNKET